MAYAILGTPKPAFFDSSGDPLVSGTLEIQDPDVGSAKNAYPTADDADASTNGFTSVTLDSRGEPTSKQLWGRDGDDYKVIVKDSAAATIYTIDNIRMPGKSRRPAVTFGSSDTTPTIAESKTFITNASTSANISDFDNGEVGDTIYVRGNTVESGLADSAIMSLHNSGNFVLGDDDVICLHMFEDGVWSEVSRTITGKTIGKVGSDVTFGNTTLANVSGLSSIFLRATKYYAFTGFLKVISDGNTQDIKIALQTDDAFQEAYWSYYNVNSAGTLTADSDTATTAMTIDIVTGQVHGIHLSGAFLTNAVNAPTVNFQAAQGTDAGTTTLERGSWIKFEEIPFK